MLRISHMRELGRVALGERLLEMGTIEGDCNKIMSAVFEGPEALAALVNKASSDKDAGMP